MALIENFGFSRDRVSGESSTGGGFSGSGVSVNNYVKSALFSAATGNLTLAREGLSDLSVNLDGRYALSSDLDLTLDDVLNNGNTSSLGLTVGASTFNGSITSTDIIKGGVLSVESTVPTVNFMETDITGQWRWRASNGELRGQYASDGSTYSDKIAFGGSSAVIQTSTTINGNATVNGISYLNSSAIIKVNGVASGNVFSNTPTLWIDSAGSSDAYPAIGITTNVGNVFEVSNAGNLRMTGTATINGNTTVNGLNTISATIPTIRLNETDTTDKNYVLRSNGGDFFIGQSNDAYSTFIELFKADETEITHSVNTTVNGSLTFTGSVNSGTSTQILKGDGSLESDATYLKTSTISGNGDIIIGADNSGNLSPVTIGSGLSYSGGVLTATGGAAGTVTTSNSATAGKLAKFTSASNIEESTISETASLVTVDNSLTVNGNLTTTGFLDFERINSNHLGRYKMSRTSGGYVSFYNSYNSENYYVGYIGTGSSLRSGGTRSDFIIRAESTGYLASVTASALSWNATEVRFHKRTNFLSSTWHVSGDGSQRLYFTFNSHTYIKSPTDIIFRTGNTHSNKVIISSNGSVTVAGQVSATTIVKSGGTSSQFLKADGSVDSNSYYLASNPNGYTSNIGDITGVTAGTNLTGGGTSGSVTVNLASTVTITGNMTAANFFRGSARHLKQDIKDLVFSWEDAKQVKTREYYKKASGLKEFGYVIDELPSKLQEVAREDKESLDYESVNTAMIAAMMKKIQELEEEIKELKK